MKLYSTLLLTTSLLIASCGFHLRGSDPGASTRLASIVIADAGATGLVNEVRILLESGGTAVLTQSAAPAYVLQLSEQTLTRNVLSVSAATGKVEEYQLTLSARLTIMDPEQNLLITGQPVQITRSFAFDDAAVLGSVQEQRLIEQEMTRQAAAQIVRRLNAVTGN